MGKESNTAQESTDTTYRQTDIVEEPNTTTGTTATLRDHDGQLPNRNDNGNLPLHNKDEHTDGRSGEQERGAERTGRHRDTMTGEPLAKTAGHKEWDEQDRELAAELTRMSEDTPGEGAAGHELDTPTDYLEHEAQESPTMTPHEDLISLDDNDLLVPHFLRIPTPPYQPSDIITVDDLIQLEGSDDESPESSSSGHTSPNFALRPVSPTPLAERPRVPRAPPLSRPIRPHPPPQPQVDMAAGNAQANRLIDYTSFYGDNRKGESADTWWRGLVMRAMDMEERDVLRRFPYLLGGRSPAERWYEGLRLDERHDWHALTAAFRERWLNDDIDETPLEEKIRQLRECTISYEDVGGVDKDEVTGRVVAKHVKWAREIQMLANEAEDRGILIGEVRGKMPRPLKDLVNGRFDTWGQFVSAVTRVSVQDLREKKTQHDEFAAMEERLKANDSIVTALSAQLATINMRQISAWTNPLAQPIFATPAPQTTPQTPLPPTNPRAMNATPYAQTPGTPFGGRLGFQRWPRAPVPTEPPRDLAPEVTVSVDPPPHNPEGLVQYRKNIREYERKWGQYTLPTPFNPYPLSPGTSPLGSGECYNCGKTDPPHRMAECIQLPVPRTEMEWRRREGARLRYATPYPPTPGTPTPVRLMTIADALEMELKGKGRESPEQRDGRLE